MQLFCGCAVYMALVPFFFLILLKSQLILGNSKSLSTGQTQLIFIKSYRSRRRGISKEVFPAPVPVHLIIVAIHQ